MIYLAFICAALVCLLAYREWVGVRERREVRAEAARERQELYQRIQAPERAIDEHTRAQRPERPKIRPIAADDDAAFMARDGVKNAD